MANVSREIKTIFSIDGEKKYSDAIKDITRQQSLLKAEMNAEAAAFDANGDKQGKLKAITEGLTKQIELQKQKVAEAKNAMEEAAKRTDVSAETTDKLKMEYLNAETALSKLNGQLVKSSIELANQESKLKASGEAAKKAGEKMNSVGDGMTKFVTMPAAAAAAGLVVLVKKTLDVVDNLSKLSTVTGLSTDRLQELGYVSTKLDGDLDTIAKSQAKLTKSMDAAKKPTSEQAKAFKELGIDALDPLTGKLRDSKVVWEEVIDALGQMENPTERDATAMKLLGKSAMELNPLIKAGSVEIARLTKEAHDNGAVMSGEQVQALDAFGDSLSAAKISLTSASSEIVYKMLPALNKLLPIIVKDIVPAIGDAAEVVGDLVDGFFDLPKPMQSFITGLGLILVVSGPVLKVAGSITTIYGNMAIKAGTAAAATEGLAAAEGKATVAGASMLATLAPLLIVAAAIGATAIAMDYMTEASQESKKASDELVRSTQESAKAFENQSEEASINATVAQKLSDELYTLSAKENKSNTEKLKMTQLVKQLNDLMPELNLTIDDQTGALNKNKSAVDDLIKSKLKDLKMQASQQRLLELYKENVKITEDLAQATERWVEASDAYNPIDIRNSLDISNYKKSVDVLTSALDSNNTSTVSLEAAYGDMTAGVITSNDALTKSVSETTELTQEELEAQVAAAEKAAADLEQSAKDHLAEMGTIEQNGIEQNKISADQVKKNLEQQIIDYQNWRSNIKSLASKVPTDVMTELSALGPSFAPMIDELNTMTDEKLQEWVDVWNTKGDLAKTAAEEDAAALAAALGGSTGAAAQSGKDLGFAFETALRNQLAGIVIPPVRITASTYFTPLNNLPAPTGFAIGTKYLPKDMIIQAHEGELIVPKSENPYANSGGNILTDSAAVEAMIRAQYEQSGLDQTINMTNRKSASMEAVRAGSSRGSDLSRSINNTTDNSTIVSMAGATMIIRNEADIDKIAVALLKKANKEKAAKGV